MKTHVHCDECDRDCPPFDTARLTGWFISHDLSVSGIPNTVICPKCLPLREGVILHD